MTYLLLSLLIIVLTYALSMFLVMKKVLAWKYKALIYGILTFFMLLVVFLSFSRYDSAQRELTVRSTPSQSRGIDHDRR